MLGNPTGDLEFAEVEARSIASQFGIDALLNERASRAALLDAPPGLAFIHVASHGFHNQTDPLLSGIVLADGNVTVEDIMESKISTRLLTLSACVTGVAETRPGDEFVGLSRAAAIAGTPSVIVTPWEIHDESASQFFRRFYENLSEGMPKDFALKSVQCELIESSDLCHPVHWTPFVIFGVWS